MSQSIKKKQKRKVAEYSNKHYRDSKMDRMSPYSTQKEKRKKVAGGKQEQKRILTMHYKQKDSKTNVEKLRRMYNIAGITIRKGSREREIHL
jgi:hypothetical protein